MIQTIKKQGIIKSLSLFFRLKKVHVDNQQTKILVAIMLKSSMVWMEHIRGRSHALESKPNEMNRDSAEAIAWIDIPMIPDGLTARHAVLVNDGFSKLDVTSVTQNRVIDKGTKYPGKVNDVCNDAVDFCISIVNSSFSINEFLFAMILLTLEIVFPMKSLLDTDEL
jgi:hypothetical protein